MSVEEDSALSWGDGLWWIARVCAMGILVFLLPMALSFFHTAPSGPREWTLLLAFTTMALGLILGIWRCLPGGIAVVLGGVGAMSTDLVEYGFLTPHMAMLSPVILVGLAYCWVGLFRWCEQRHC